MLGWAANESCSGNVAFWKYVITVPWLGFWPGKCADHSCLCSWPQAVDKLLEDMDLTTMRSGGNWLTWPFKVIDLREIEFLKEERDAKREEYERWFETPAQTPKD